MKRTFWHSILKPPTHKPQSACAIGVVRVEDDQVVAQESRLIRPPSRFFAFTDIHGITWDDVKDAPRFADVARVTATVRRCDVYCRSQRGFDRGAAGLFEDAGLPPPKLPFVCTMHMARRVLGIYPTGLAVVAARLNVALNHHDALSDAHACAQIVIAARKLREDAHRTAVMAPLALSSP